MALLVSAQSFSESVIELARRFGVALFSTADGIDRVALALARELGSLEAGVLARLDALHSRIIRAETVPEALSELSLELGDGLVQLLVEGVEVASVGRRPTEARVLRLPITASEQSPELEVVVAPQHREFAEQAVARARVTLRSLLLAQQLDDISRAAPLLTLAALTGLREVNAIDDALPDESELMRWPSQTPVAAVVLRIARGDVDQRAARVAPVVTSRWRAAFPNAPLARVHAGWFALVPVTSADTDLEQTLRALTTTAFAPLGVAVGLAHDLERGRDVRMLLRRAWLASRLAEPGGALVEFELFGLPAVRRLLPAEDALDLALAVFPRLLADQHAADIITTVVAYLDCAGTATVAAERLGIHRNTLQLRLRRADALGVPLASPEQLLAAHLVLSALDLESMRNAALDGREGPDGPLAHPDSIDPDDR